MRIFTVALGSFALGGAVMFLLGNHTSTRLQAQTPSPPPTQSPNSDIARVCGSPPPGENTWSPFVPPTSGFFSEGNIVEGSEASLDGALSRHDVFRNATIKYAGGNFELRDATFSRNINFELLGAAHNTF